MSNLNQLRQIRKFSHTQPGSTVWSWLSRIQGFMYPRGWLLFDFWALLPWYVTSFSPAQFFHAAREDGPLYGQTHIVQLSKCSRQNYFSFSVLVGPEYLRDTGYGSLQRMGLEGWYIYKAKFGDGQGGLACCGSWGRKESDTTEQLNWTEVTQLRN